MTTMKLSIEGVEHLQSLLKRYETAAEMLQVVKPPMVRAGANILAASKRITPRMDGVLVNSANLGVHLTIHTIDVTLGFNTPYAYAVHQNPRSGHTGGRSPSGQRYKKWAHVGQSKYLKGPVTDAERTVWADVAHGIEAWLQRSV